MTRTAPTILIVGDEEPVRTIVVKDLRKARFQAIGAANADEVVAILRGRPWVDLVLTDLSLPGAVDGIGRARFVRRWKPNIKVVFLSPDATHVSLRAWGDGFLIKPCEWRALVQTLANVLLAR